MAKTALEKMLLKPADRAAILHAPAGLDGQLRAEHESTRHINGQTYDFILAFYTTLESA